MTEEEKYACISRMRLDAHGATTTDVNDERFSWYWVRRALLNVNTIVLSLNFFAIITPIYSFSLFLPTIIRALGKCSGTSRCETITNCTSLLDRIFPSESTALDRTT